ncbi:MAG: AAA family ATPase [Pirellulaceae bacterium]|nr:AAA family ATPase [Pirellulaceae bacterium]
MLPSFEIENFRAFSQLRIGHLGGVNLVVGRNNVGKTMLLEAIRFYASGGNPTLLIDLLQDRDEILLGHHSDEEPRNAHLHFASLFFGREITNGPDGAAILQANQKDPSAIRVEVGLFRRIPSKQTPGRYHIEPVDETESDDLRVFQAISILFGGNQIRFLPLDDLYRFRYRIPRNPQPDVPYEYSMPAFVPANGVDQKTLLRQWDSIALRDAAEDRVNQCLDIVAPVARITAVEHSDRPHSRMFMVRMRGKNEPVPLKSVGDGMVHIFQIALAVESAINGWALPSPKVPKSLLPDFPPMHPAGVLLVDELENGVHFSILPKLWKFIFQASRLNNVQVFATTHSWDCVEAFQTVAAEERDVEGALIRLEKSGDYNKAVTFSEEELAIVARDQIEVR